MSRKNKSILLILYVIKKWTDKITVKKGIHSELKIVPLNKLNYFDGLIPSDKELIPAILEHCTINKN